mgnify:FL=1
MRSVMFHALSAVVFMGGLANMAPAQVNIGFGGVPHAQDQTIEVTADTLQVDETTGDAIFSGNVIVVQGDLRMAAENVHVSYAQENDGPREIVAVTASGGVLLTQGAAAAEGTEARYDVRENVIRLNGDVMVAQGDLNLAGERLVIDMITGQGTMVGRVRTTLGAAESE